MKLRLVALAVLIAALLTVALTAAWERRDLRSGEAWLRLHDGARVAVADGGDAFARVTRDRRLAPGDRVRVVAGGATLEMARGLEVELRRDSDVTVDHTPVLHSGDALVRTDSAAARFQAASSAAALVEPASVAKLSRSLSYRTAVYRGNASLHSVGHSVGVPALRHASVSAVGAVSSRALPIVVDTTDGWDRRYLSAAIELTRQLDAVSDGFSANVVTTHRPLADLVLDAIPSAVRTEELESVSADPRRPGEVLVGTAIATAADAPLEPVFGFRDEGATWGLVALDQQIAEGDRLFRLLRLALGDAPILATSVAAPAAPAPAGGDSVDTARGMPPDPATPTDDPSEPDPISPTDPVDDVVEETADTVADTVDELGGELDVVVDDVVGFVTEEEEKTLDGVTTTTILDVDGAGQTVEEESGSLLGP